MLWEVSGGKSRFKVDIRKDLVDWAWSKRWNSGGTRRGRRLFTSHKRIKKLSLDAKEDVGWFPRLKWSGWSRSWRETFSSKGFLMNYWDKSRSRRASVLRLSLTKVSGMAFVFRDIYLMCIRENILQLSCQSCDFLGQHKIC